MFDKGKEKINIAADVVYMECIYWNLFITICTRATIIYIKRVAQTQYEATPVLSYV